MSSGLSWDSACLGVVLPKGGSDAHVSGRPAHGRAARRDEVSWAGRPAPLSGRLLRGCGVRALGLTWLSRVRAIPLDQGPPVTSSQPGDL